MILYNFVSIFFYFFLVFLQIGITVNVDKLDTTIKCWCKLLLCTMENVSYVLIIPFKKVQHQIVNTSRYTTVELIMQKNNNNSMTNIIVKSIRSQR